MHIDWQALGSAFALYLVLEGLLPFASPNLYQAALRRFAQSTPLQLRIAGLVSILSGCILLHWIRG
jgi:hypothetical protein